MNSKRLELLKGFAEQDPEDPFNWYAIAMEYTQEAPSKALELFRDIVEKFPDYLPTYYQYGVIASQLSGIDAALQILDEGIRLAMKQNEIKSLNELRNFRNELADD